MIPEVKEETLDAILAQIDQKDNQLTYLTEMLDQLEVEQPAIAQYAKAAAKKVMDIYIQPVKAVIGSSLEDRIVNIGDGILAADDVERMLVHIFSFILTPIKALYNQQECNEL